MAVSKMVKVVIIIGPQWLIRTSAMCVWLVQTDKFEFGGDENKLMCLRNSGENMKSQIYE